MLRQRVITALVLAPLALAAILFLPSLPLSGVFALVGAIAAWEWASLGGLQTPAMRLGYALLVTAAIAGFIALDMPASPHAGAAVAAHPAAVDWLLGAALLWWLVAPVWLLRYPREFGAGQPGKGQRLLLGVLVVPAAVMGLSRIRETGLGVSGLLTVFAVVWAADIAAYFAGRAWGRRKLAPNVSPGKTWEGFAGGLAGALAVGVVSAIALLAAPRPWTAWLSLCVAVAAISVVGDLVESLLKRLAGVKDSGTILPGHGGILDRIDSLLAAAPAMALGLRALGL